MSVLRFEPFRDPFERLFSMAATGTRAPLGMPMDVYRGEDGSYHVEADLPGADPDSIEVTVEHGTVTIQAERTPHYGDSEQVIAAERPQGSFARRLALGEGVDAENLTAGYADGVLHVTIPASPKAQARRAASCRGARSSRVRRPPAARAAAPTERPVPCRRKLYRLSLPSTSGPDPRWSHLWQRGLSRKLMMVYGEDPVHAAIPPGRTAGRTAAGTAITAADLHRPVPRRQGTRGARRGTRPACRAAAGLPGR